MGSPAARAHLGPALLATAWHALRADVSLRRNFVVAVREYGCGARTDL